MQHPTQVIRTPPTLGARLVYFTAPGTFRTS